MYAPLWCKSNFSFLEGASHAEELVEEAHRLGIGSLALTDRDGVYGMVRAHVKARELGVHLLCGVQISVAPPDVELTPSPVSSGAVQGEHEGRGPGWGKDTDDPLPAGKVTGRRRNAKRAKPRQVAAGSRRKPSTSAMVLLATDRAGWANMMRLITAGRRRSDKGESMVAWSEVGDHAAGL
ncbi:MAG TPA: PHP domain-containing protein, partial [Kofleriaceae bacterium]